MHQIGAKWIYYPEIRRKYILLASLFLAGPVQSHPLTLMHTHQIILSDFPSEQNTSVSLCFGIVTNQALQGFPSNAENGRKVFFIMMDFSVRPLLLPLCADQWKKQ